MELSESRTQGCGFEYESVPMLQNHLMSQASLIKAEVFKHILCERNMQDFKQFILTCLERWKSGHYLQEKSKLFLPLLNIRMITILFSFYTFLKARLDTYVSTIVMAASMYLSKRVQQAHSLRHWQYY